MRWWDNGTYDVEEGCDALLVRRHHAFDNFHFAFVILEQDLLSGDRVRFFPTDAGHPFRTGPETASNVLNVDRVIWVFSRSPSVARALTMSICASK